MTHPLDHDGDGRPGGSLPDPERAAIIAQLDDLKIPFFKGATTEKLRAKLAAAQGAAPETPPGAEQTPPEQQPDEPIMTAAPDAPIHPESPAARLAAVQAREARLVAEEQAQKAAVDAAQADDTLVAVRILKAGDGKVAKGYAVNNVEQWYARGEIVRLPRDTANALEERGLAEIED